MSSAIGGLSAAKRRRGSSQHINATTNTSSRTQSFVSQSPEVNSNMIQVSPLEMLKMHESRLRRIETMESSESKGPEEQTAGFDEMLHTVLSELDISKKTTDDTSLVIRELKTNIRSLQTQVALSARTISTMQEEITAIKTEMTTMKMAAVSMSETAPEDALQTVPESFDGDGDGVVDDNN
jgi:hypothetical protein